MKSKKKVWIVMIVLSLFVAGMMLAGGGNGNGNGNGGSNAGSGPADGTGYGPGDGTGAQPGDGTGFGAGGSGNAGGYGPGDCAEIAKNLNANQAYSAEEIAEAFGLQVEQVYQLMNEGILKTIRSQNQLRVLGSEIQEKVNEIAKLME
ncbi:MAG TPA: helix-turn-helix domain-containing protein [Thermotogota bacterium]|nr:helix-turn-helix domain-containing protein [Thermotogota bacterium]HRW35716.1 helix-turn-helix domain-containing protein [Thermotogota bacterium]